MVITVGLGISGFGFPALAPIVILYMFFNIICLPLRRCVDLMERFGYYLSATPSWEKCVLRIARALLLDISSMRERYEIWASDILRVALPPSLIWPAINHTTMDRFVLTIRQLQKRLRPGSPVGNLVEVALVVILYYATSDIAAQMFFGFIIEVLRPTKVLFERLMGFYATAVFRYGVSVGQEWQDAHSANFHTYQGLRLTKETSIRLLTIRPGSRRGPLSCFLQVAQLSNDEQHGQVYEAVSYVWESDPPSVEITVNGQPFLVSRSLHHMIARLRSPAKPRVVWIDAICIDQGNMDERASQVRRMAQIYSSAQQVVVWLGSRSPWGLGPAFQHAKQNPSVGGVHYGSICVATALLSNPWWTRTWVVQEVVLARRAVVHCGEYKLDWDDFSRLIHQASSHACFRAETCGVHLGGFLSIDMHHRRRRKRVGLDQAQGTCQTLSKPAPSASRGVNILALVFDFRTREATDPRDKIFALQGLSDEPEMCVPSYVRPARELVIEFAKEHIRHSRKLSVLALAECIRQHRSLEKAPEEEQDNLASFPSWCPALTDRDAVKKGLQLKPLWTGLPDDDKYGFHSAAGNLAIPEGFTFDVPEAEDQLSVHVLRHVRLTVSLVGPAYHATVDSLKRELMDVMRGRPSSMRSSLMGFLDKESVLDTWSRLAEESSPDSTPNKDSSPVPYGGETKTDIFGRILAGGESASVPDEAPGQLRDNMRKRVYTRRKFFTTQCGNSGLGPEDLLEGDEVCIALGCQTPIVLRKESMKGGNNNAEDAKEYYSYIGQAYVEHLMAYKGDLADELRTGRVKTERRILV
ncbi:uncharacterized protein PG998_000027 [Apiospora kogelbergensis]|uniref:uncharacterized protein n=1 Tax=Apiospora kogelbergensis TaxID=1337665 RepID=UPI00312F3D04